MVLPEDLVPSPGHRLSSIVSKAEKALGTRLGQCCWLSIHAGLSTDRSAVNYALKSILITEKLKDLNLGPHTRQQANEYVEMKYRSNV